MRYNGLNILAIVVAAIVIYLIEFVIFGLAISPEQYQIMSGMSAEQQNATMMARMAFGPVMPILAAIGIALVIKWRSAIGMSGGAVTGALMPCCLRSRGGCMALCTAPIRKPIC
ncbi:MAG: hypothetical protein WDM79_17315 [Terricaulis sp.]